MTTEQFASLNIPQSLKQNNTIQELFYKYGGIFSFDGTFKQTNILEHEIVLKPGAKSVK